MSQEAFLIEMTIQVICGTPLTQRMLQTILTELAELIASQTDGQILSASYNSTQSEVLH